MTVRTAGSGARFSVVIVNYNGGSMLRQCVDSVVREGVPASQIIVVDNGSRDGSIDALEIPPENRPLQKHPFGTIAVIRNQCNAGFSRAVNQGIRLALADPSPPEFILLLNNDAQLDSGAFQAFADGFHNCPNLAIAGGQLRYPDGRLQSAFAPLPSLAEELLPRFVLKLFFPQRFQRKSTADGPKAVECILGACLCVRSASLPKLGLLDEDYFFFFEEIDWCRRAWRIGAEVYYLPAARAIHGQGQTANRFRGPSRVEYQRSKLTFFRKTRKPPVYLVMLIVIVLRTLVNAVVGVVACGGTLFLNKQVRARAAIYWYLLLWHILLRPAGWGLPGKCADAAFRDRI